MAEEDNIKLFTLARLSYTWAKIKAWCQLNFTTALMRLTGYRKADIITYIAETDSINEAIGKLEKRIEAPTGAESVSLAGCHSADSALTGDTLEEWIPSVEDAIHQASGSGSSVTVDAALSSTSTNPVQNKVIKAALDLLRTVGAESVNIEGCHSSSSALAGDTLEEWISNAEDAIHQAAALAGSGDFLPLSGGTLTGDLRLKDSSNYGRKINLGDGDYVHISEPTDDILELKGDKGVNVVTGSSGSLKVNSTKVALEGHTHTMADIVGIDGSSTNLSEMFADVREDFNTALENQTHVSSDITRMAGYSKPNAFSAISPNDTLNAAIGKLEKGLSSPTGAESVSLAGCHSADSALTGDTLEEWIPSVEDAIHQASGSGSSVTVDAALSSTSTNPVQNKVIKAALDLLRTVGAESVNIEGCHSSSSALAGDTLEEWIPNVESAIGHSSSVGHTHVSSEIISMPGLREVSCYNEDSIATSDSLNTVIGKILYLLSQKVTAGDGILGEFIDINYHSTTNPIEGDTLETWMPNVEDAIANRGNSKSSLIKLTSSTFTPIWGERYYIENPVTALSVSTPLTPSSDNLGAESSVLFHAGENARLNLPANARLSESSGDGTLLRRCYLLNMRRDPVTGFLLFDLTNYGAYQKFTLVINMASPTTAKISFDGVRQGATTFISSARITKWDGDAAVTWKVEKLGYKTKTGTWNPISNQTISVSLVEDTRIPDAGDAELSS